MFTSSLSAVDGTGQLCTPPAITLQERAPRQVPMIQYGFTSQPFWTQCISEDRARNVPESIQSMTIRRTIHQLVNSYELLCPSSAPPPVPSPATHPAVWPVFNASSC